MSANVDMPDCIRNEDMERIARAVKKAEESTSAQIKVVVLRHSWINLRDRAMRIFRKHGLDKTRQRNAVLILVVLANREFIVYGDQGIHRHAGQNFWNEVRDGMAGHFAADRLAEGLCSGIRRIGDQLSQFFPAQPGAGNEIADDVAIEN